MRIVRHVERELGHLTAPVVTLGNFDGVHCGHREILSRVVRQARERSATPLVLTFFPHPAAVLAPERAPTPLAPLADRLERFREAGIDIVIVHPFTRAFASLEAEDFIRRYLVETLHVQKVVIGHSVSFGKARRGNAAALQDGGTRHGFEVEVVGPVTVDGIAVSSTEVRNRLGAGEVTVAARLLGREYTVSGRVIRGEQRGRTIGFPTANLRPRLGPIVPNGVYAVRVEAGGEIRRGVANVGFNPTFGPGRERTLEAHIFDFAGDLYGKRLRVSFVERLRGEMKFPSITALVEQIRSDADRAREVLAR